MGRLTQDIESALAMRSANMATASIARTLSRSEGWVELQFELAEEKAVREADAEETGRRRRLAAKEAFRLAQEKGRATRAARKASDDQAKICSIDARDYPTRSFSGVVERTFRTSIGYGAAVRLGGDAGRLLFVETLINRLDVGQPVTPIACVWTWYVDDAGADRMAA